MEEGTNNLVIQEAGDLPPEVFLSVPEIPSTITPLDLSLPLNTASFIDLTNEPSPPESPNDCVAILPNGSNENDDSLDESLSIVYENIKPPPDLNVEVDQGSGDIVVELLKSHSEPYSGYLTKKIKLGPSNVNVCVTVNTVKKTSISDPTNPVAQRVRRKISISNLLGTKIPTPQIETQSASSICQSTSASSSNSTVDCGICLDSYSEIVATERKLMSTSCGHVFCNVCIEKCRANYKQCPKCRKRLTKKSYHPLYLS